MSARVVIAAMAIAVLVVGAGAFALLAVSEPESPVDEESPDLREDPDHGAEDGAGDDGETLRADPEAAPVPADGAPWIELPGWEDAQRAIDWREVGDAYAELVPLLTARARAITRETAPAAADAARIEALRAEIDRLVEPVRRRAPFCAANGAVLHPAFLVNAVAATLQARGRGLTTEQLESLTVIGREALDTDAVLEGAAGDTEAPVLFRALTECELRRGLADRIDDALDARRRKLLHPNEILGRAGLDPLQGVEVFRDRITVIEFEDDEDAARQIVDLVAAEFPVDERMHAIGVDMLEPMMAMGRESVFPLGLRNVDREGHVIVETIAMACVHTEELVSHLVGVFTDGNPPSIPPEVLQRPIILIRGSGD